MSRRPPRPFLLSLLVLLAGCRPGEPPEPASGSRSAHLPHPLVLRDFDLQAPRARCDRLAGPGPLRSLTPAGKGRLLALPASGARVDLLGPGMERLASRNLEPLEGSPGTGIPAPLHRDPVDAWLLGDTLLAVLDGPGRALVLHPGGMLQSGPALKVELPFHPLRAVPVGGGLALVSPGPVGGRLVHLWVGGSELRSLDIMTPPVDDARLMVLVSALVPVDLPRGEAAFLHPVLLPRGYRVRPDGAVSSFVLPIPDGQADRVGWVPRFPWSEDELVSLLATALDAAPDPGGGFLLLTRSGRWHHGFREKAVIRIDRDLRPVQAMRLPVNAVRAVSTPLADRVAVEDQEGSWFRCGGFGTLRPAESVPSSHGEAARAGAE